jgi:hypothetical protein
MFPSCDVSAFHDHDTIIAAEFTHADFDKQGAFCEWILTHAKTYFKERDP